VLRQLDLREKRGARQIKLGPLHGDPVRAVPQLSARARKIDKEPGDARVSPPVRHFAGALMRLATMSRTVRVNFEGELERVLFPHLRDFTAGKGELHPEAKKQLKGLGDLLGSALDAIATGLEVIQAAEKELDRRQGIAA